MFLAKTVQSLLGYLVYAMKSVVFWVLWTMLKFKINRLVKTFPEKKSDREKLS